MNENATITTFTSPALTFIGRKNSGKTTLLVKLIAELTARGVDVATLKHHGHPGFEIDVPGKDSYRHRKAGARTAAILSEDTFAYIQDLNAPLSCLDALSHLGGHDVVLIEGFRDTGLPSVEIMRAASQRDRDYVPTFIEAITTLDPWDMQRPVAAISDISAAVEACQSADVPCFDPEDAPGLATFVQQRFVRGKLSVAIQAGGESKRMGQSKALVEFRGKPLIAHMVKRLEPIADELIITTREPQALAFLQEDYPQVRLVPDIREERGTLPGMLTALASATCPYVAVVACDMVATSPSMLCDELALLQKSGRNAVIPVTKHGFEPLNAVYRTRAFLQVAQDCYNQGERKMQNVVRQLDPVRLERHNPYGIAFPLGCFMNVNTPDELRFAEKLLEY